MLKFNPPHYLTFTPNSQQKMHTNFIISNQSNHKAPFKIKSTKPDLFFVEPYVGVIDPLQQISVQVISQSKGHISTNKDIKFQIEYCMIDNHPQDLKKALASITQQNKQIHVLYASYQNKDSNNQNEIKSSTSIKNHIFKVPQYNIQDRAQDYNHKNDEQKLDYLKHQIDNLEKHRGQLIKASKPNRRNYNLVLMIAIFIISLIVGNLIGKSIGLGGRKNKVRQYKYFGLEKIWAGESQENQKKWYQFWK